MMQEEREDEIVTEFALLYVGKDLFTAVDINSPEDSAEFEGIIRFDHTQFAKRVINDVNFALYHKTNK
jgi:hypothetical protein